MVYYLHRRSVLVASLPKALCLLLQLHELVIQLGHKPWVCVGIALLTVDHQGFDIVPDRSRSTIIIDT